MLGSCPDTPYDPFWLEPTGEPEAQGENGIQRHVRGVDPAARASLLAGHPVGRDTRRTASENANGATGD